MGAADEKYRVHLTEAERDELDQVVNQGRHRSQKVLNTLILLNCDEGPYQVQRMRNEDVAAVLRISLRKNDRIKRRFVEGGLGVALDGQPREREYVRKADGDFEVHMVALS